MAIRLATPGVFVEEISLLPPSVVEVGTAIPAFIGHTEKGQDLPPTRIDSMMDYAQFFGGPSLAEYKVSVTVNPDSTITLDTTESKSDYKKYLLYQQVRMHFVNGGGSCYIASTGDYSVPPSKDTLTGAKGLPLIEKEDEPTLLIFPDAAAMGDEGEGDLKKPASFAVYEAALLQCSLKKDRFALMDLKTSQVNDFRNKGFADNLKYGAAYTPYLATSITVPYKEENVTVTGVIIKDVPDVKLPLLKTGVNNQIYNLIKNELAKRTLTLPPTGAMSGVYARVDRERGVWKAPANVGILGILGPAEKISDTQQEELNLHVSGKSINAIRSFPGKGTLVWGARTLDGNSNEWRYINVRRLFIMVEESIQKASAFAVFEPNTASTWLKVKAMIESFLYNLWQQGALAGSSPKEAYRIEVGLGITMNENDINNGLMRVRVGIAAVRPAEFILLEFSHKMISDN